MWHEQHRRVELVQPVVLARRNDQVEPRPHGLIPRHDGGVQQLEMTRDAGAERAALDRVVREHDLHPQIRLDQRQHVEQSSQRGGRPDDAQHEPFEADGVPLPVARVSRDPLPMRRGGVPFPGCSSDVGMRST